MLIKGRRCEGHLSGPVSIGCQAEKQEGMEEDMADFFFLRRAVEATRAGDGQDKDGRRVPVGLAVEEAVTDRDDWSPSNAEPRGQ